MTRPSDISTKAIACRVPMQDYIKFLTEASNKGMSISEWLLMKIYSTKPVKDQQKVSKSALEAKEREIDKLQKQIEELTKEREQLKSESETIQDQVYRMYLYAKSHKTEVVGEDILVYMSRLFPNADLEY